MSLPRYLEYKDSGVEWLGEVPAHWNVDALRRRAALNPSKSEIRELPGDAMVSFLPMEAVGESGELDLSRTRQISDVLSGYTYFREGDVTFAKITPCFENGKGARMVGLYGGHGFGTTELTVARPNPDLLDSHYLDWVFRSTPFRKRGEAAMYGAGGQKRVPDEFVREFAFGWPSVEEQISIARFLDRETARIDALIAEQETLLALLAEKRQATISHAVTRGLDPNVPMKDSGTTWLGEVPAHWNVLAIKQCSPVQRGASPRPIDDPKYFDEDGDYAWVRISDVSSSGGLLESTDQRLSELGASLSVKLDPGSLFISIAGSVGKPCITKINACIHDGFVYFPSLKIPPMFLFRIFEAGACYAGLGKMGTQLNLNTDTVGAIQIAVPPNSELNEILRFLEEKLSDLDVLASHARAAASLLSERRSALISAAVTGQIDVRGLGERHAA